MTESIADNMYLKRSNALRIKSNNLDLLPYSLRESLLLLRNRLKNQKEEEDLSLLDQIKRGVNLKPVGEKSRKNGSIQAGQACDLSDETDISRLLIRVLRQRYTAIQLTDDESDVSSIDSSDDDNDDEDKHKHRDQTLRLNENKYHVLYENQSIACNTLRSRSFSKRILNTRSLLQQLGEHTTHKLELTNELIIKL